MRTRHLMALFTGVLILAIILPISLSIWQAARQAKMQFYRELDDYSNRIVVRTLQVADQAREALREADAHTAASCSPEHLLTLRRIAYTHRYIQEVLWLRDSVPQCSSLEDHSVAVTFPPPDHIAPDGYRTWLTSINDLGLDHQMTAMGSRQQPDGTFLSPDIFIPLAEQTGLITQLTEDIVRKIFADLGPWLRQRPEVHISINLSVDDLRSPTLPTLLHNQLQHWGIAAEQIILEITERGFVDPETTMPVIAHYRQAGHRISIDDFGTGYSSLSYLQKLDVDTLKIDKSFVDTLEYRPLTPHIIEMAKALNLATVAEGVETESQRDWLRQHGVQYAQGWLYSKALPKEQFILWAEHNLHAH
ncbi:TPA: EAL domain-containing protein [Klebsiella pneumoniae]|nr:EAL domain-containing protein [Klebsiella pneumoniae]